MKSAAEKRDKDAPVLSDAERVKRQRELSEMDKDYQRRQREFREDLNQRRNEELAAVLEKANKVIRQLAEAETVSYTHLTLPTIFRLWHYLVTEVVRTQTRTNRNNMCVRYTPRVCVCAIYTTCPTEVRSTRTAGDQPPQDPRCITGSSRAPPMSSPAKA